MTKPDGVTPIVKVSQYIIDLLPEDELGSFLSWQITVEYRGHDRWAVIHRGYCLSADGEWEYEMRPSEREEDWLASHRFDLDTALDLAKKAAPKLSVNGRTAKEFLDDPRRSR